MKINFEKDGSNIVAVDDAEGKFFLGNKGEVLYIGPGEHEAWRVNSNLEKFRKSVFAYQRYCEKVVEQSTEAEEQEVVMEFSVNIAEVEPYENVNKSYWACIIQQAEHGQI